MCVRAYMFSPPAVMMSSLMRPVMRTKPDGLGVCNEESIRRNDGG